MPTIDPHKEADLELSLLIMDSELLGSERILPLLKESNELTAIFTSMVINAKRNS